MVFFYYITDIEKDLPILAGLFLLSFVYLEDLILRIPAPFSFVSFTVPHPAEKDKPLLLAQTIPVFCRILAVPKLLPVLLRLLRLFHQVLHSLLVLVDLVRMGDGPYIFQQG